ncbi:sugar transferase [Butyrivibrio sp. MC2021]|uniref:sugar transferase n=1 Tax=Butyrivibrio sp. MC2021 TaxID=1408306 RepID=UPI000478FBB2|nr:sugar transferase [Butyrivibrio sp. MC2021]
MNQKNKVLQTYGLWIIDMACIVITYCFATWLRYNNNNDWGNKTLHYMVCLVFLLFCVVYTFLADWNRDFITRGYILEFISVVRFMAIMIFVCMAAVYFLNWISILSRFVMIHFIWMNIVLNYVARILFKIFLRNHISKDSRVTRVVVVAEKNLMESTIKDLVAKCKGLGYKVVRAYYVDDNDSEEADKDWYVEGVHIHKGIENLTGRLITDPFDEVFINTPSIPQSQIQDIIIGFEEMGITTHYNIELPDVSKAVTQVGDFLDYTVISYSMFRSSYKRLFIKRAIDILGGLVGLILTGIITLFLGPAIKLDSPGPIFFSQVRIGKNGRRFKIYKFRSMYTDAEERKKELEAQNEMKGLMFKMENDPRVTKVGNFIRKTSLDEFPQFLNVLKGDMSLVGTRPPTEAEFQQYNEHYRRRLSMTPGLTGLWQISGRSDIEDFDEVVKLDLKYIDNWSLTEDFKILLQTVGVVLFGKGAK